MKGTEDWLNNLKIRASYGEVGNDVYKVNGVKQRFLYQAVWTQIPTTITSEQPDIPVSMKASTLTMQ